MNVSQTKQEDAAREQDRLGALAHLEILDTAPEPLFDSLTELAARTFDAPIALISLVDTERQWFKACIGLEVDHTARDISFCQYTIQSDAALIVLDTRQDAKFRDNPLVTGAPFIRFYAGAPLITAEGHRLGSLCVIDTAPRPAFDDAQVARLRAMAETVVQAMVLRLASRERERLAATLLEREALLTQAEHMAGVGTWTLDVATMQTWWSDEVFRIHGVDPAGPSPKLEDALGRYCAEDMQMMSAFVARGLSHGEAFRTQARIVRPDGEARHIVASGAARRNGDGVITGLFGVFQDVTTLKLADTALRESEAKSRHLLENTTDMIVRINSQGVVLEASHGCQAFGYEMAAMAGKHVADFVHPDDLPAAAAAMADNFSGRPVNPDLVREYRFRTKAGDYRWVQGSPRIIRGEDGVVREIVSTFRDVTDRKEAELALAEKEARYRLLAENARDIITCYAPDGRITYVSPAVESVLGYRPDEFIGKSPWSLVHPDDVASTQQRAANYIAAGPDAGDTRYEYRAFHKDGRMLWLEASPRAIFDPVTGQLVELQDAVRDVTRRKAMELELTTARDEAVQAIGVKTEFLANMSHEIRTPLTAIIGFSNLLSTRTDLADSALSHVKRVNGASKALLAIVNDILDFSKLEAGQMSICPQAVDVADLAQDTLAMFAPQADAKALWLEFENAPGTLPVLSLDPDRTRQVLINLIGNAIKFTEAGVVRLRMNHDPARQRLRFEIEDTGPGMDEDQCCKLFQRFSQIDASSTRKHGGTGLGLAICKALVEAMDGEIGVTSLPGKGSTFFFDIRAPLHEGRPPAPAEDAATGGDMTGLRVLVADDNASNRELARLLLLHLGAEVTDVEDGRQALDAAALAPFDVILLDLHMPVMGGVETLSRLRAGDGPNQDVPVLAFTANPADNALGVGSGFDGIVGKPVNVADLAIELDRVTRWQDPSPFSEGIQANGS